MLLLKQRSCACQLFAVTVDLFSLELHLTSESYDFSKAIPL